MVIGLTYDFYHRRNMRNAHRPGKLTTPFISATYGSHHIHLVNAIALLWKAAINRPKVKSRQHNLPSRPTLRLVESGETFGLVDSVGELALGSTISTKEEGGADEGLLTEDGMMSTADETDLELLDMLAGLGLEIQPTQLLRPLQRAAVARQASQQSSASMVAAEGSTSQSPGGEPERVVLVSLI
jgi:hypothetical protein